MRNSPFSPTNGVSQPDTEFTAESGGPRQSLGQLDHLAAVGTVAMCALVLGSVMEAVTPPLSHGALQGGSWGIGLVLVIWALALGFVLMLWLNPRRSRVDHQTKGEYQAYSDRAKPQDPAARVETDDDDDDAQGQPGMPGRWLIH